MCGICGIFNTKGTNIDISTDVLIRMRDALVHRGPDDAGEFVNANIGLAIRRLKIIDLETGHQPIHNEDKTIWIVFNGEIYNFLELKRELMGMGHKFYTKSDTEIIIHLYEESGKECVKKLNGMFSFAIWDSRKNELFLARDRLGQKPLYYGFIEGQFIFSSEAKSILKHPAVSKELDIESLNEYLTFEYVPAPKSIYKRINKLPAAHIMIVTKDKIFSENYWSPKLGGLSNIDESEAVDKVFDLLQDSVKRHMISDVPLGIFLSGGIDSSAIAALASRQVKDLKTFSISFKEKSFDESRYSKLVVDYIGSEHYDISFCERDCLDTIPKIYSFLDEPFADASVLPTYLLSKFTREHVTVALGGDGGDELFAGYPTHLAHRFADNFYLHLPSFLRKYFIEPVAMRLPVSLGNFSFDFIVKKFISGVNYPPEVRHRLWMGAFSAEQKSRLFTSSIKLYLDNDKGCGCVQSSQDKAKDSEAKGSQQNIMFLDMLLYLQDDILTKVDRCSMANSLETRSPFLDNNLVEFVNGLDFNLKLKSFNSKFILKKALLTKKMLPPEIIGRWKKGFGIPVAKWIHNELKTTILDVLSEESIKKGGIFNYSYIKQLLREHFELKKDNRKLIWTLFMFELWKKEYLN